VTTLGYIMKRPRRQFLLLAAGAAALPAVSRIASAQAYPARPVRIVVGYAAGGGADLVARLIGQLLSERLGQQFVIENRTGAATNIGTEAVVHAPADGYTLLLAHTANAINATLYEKLSFNFIRDITPVAGIMRVPAVMVVNPLLPAKTVPEFIAYAKANPGKINMASGGAGGPDHMSGELFKMMTGINMVHVAYRGQSPALTDLLAGQVQVIFGTPTSSIEYIRTDKLRALAVTTATRSVLAIIRVIHDEPAFAEMFVSHLLARTIRVEADLVDQLFNSSEKRLARALLLLANFGKEGTPQPILMNVNQEMLAEMIGTTRSRVNHFMNKFRQLGFIEYNGTLVIHSSLLSVVLHDQPHIET
jgi:tripartite-type tricarboxylate transporter receptor subunit TctC